MYIYIYIPLVHTVATFCHPHLRATQPSFQIEQTLRPPRAVHRLPPECARSKETIEHVEKKDCQHEND